ncbi:MAG: ABC transporter ATP-binding protein [Candidatus Rokubacteria bacterium]|nr:ABC transporter ATP-binding protein [Candidatus Rokubacteria bacterium]
MSQAIVVTDVAKAYRRYVRPWHRLGEWLSAGRFAWHETFWALRHVSFAVAPGESVGIVGLNGAGKSTLLKILTGTAQPTEGQVWVGGRVAALLELGLGFHPDFPGRQNVLMAAQLMGLPSAQAAALLPEVEAFAEIGPYIDLPIRTYSTGMTVRLAFSAATAVRPDVLIVDETLSVGDAYFQHKCVRRIKEFKAAGTTILVVSHDAAAVKTLCDRALLLDRGRLIQDGRPDDVLDYYNALIAKRGASQEILQAEAASGRTTRSGTFQARIAEVDLLGADGRSTRAFTVGERARIRCLVQFSASVSSPTVGILIRDRVGNDVFGTNTYHTAPIEAEFAPGDELEVELEVGLNLGPGAYTLTVAVHSYATHLLDNYDWWDRVVGFEVLPGTHPVFVGTVWLPVRIRTTTHRADIAPGVGTSRQDESACAS